jgi:RNA-binding protein
MLTGKQRSYLRGLANQIDAIFQIGKSGINDNLVKQVDEALEARELIKIHVLESAEGDVRKLCEALCERTGADPVQVIGRRFSIYRPAEDPGIQLPPGR